MCCGSLKAPAAAFERDERYAGGVTLFGFRLDDARSKRDHLRRRGLGLACLERPRPAAVPLDDSVDLLHQADSLGEGDDDLLVVGDVVVGKGAALAVLEPLLAYLVAVMWKFHTASGTPRKPVVPAVAGWPFFVAAASSQTVSFDQPTRITSGFFGPV